LDSERSSGRRRDSLTRPATAALLFLTLAVALASVAGARPAPQFAPDTRSIAGPPGEGDWNAPRVRELVGRAIDRRSSWTADGELIDYRANARGHIYFLYDMGRDTERHLIKADQLALQLAWRKPDRTFQLIIGRREQEFLPTNIRYHLDHLTVVMDNYGDLIHLGEGSEVKDVMHPAASGALDFYDYRLTDSLTLMLPASEVRVYKVEMRPRDPDDPAVVGSIYLDRASADIVRMEFTFTASAYIDDSVDYISVHLENAMWGGRYWLPYRQGIELRREFTVLKFPAGSIIRGEFKISDYEFNLDLPLSQFTGPSIATVTRRLRERYEFDEGLYDALDPAVATAPPSMEAIREEAARIVTESYLQRAQEMQLAVPGVSSVLRFRRAEGLYLGPGLSQGFQNGVRLELLGGYAIGADRWELEATVKLARPGQLGVELVGYLDRVGEVSVWKPSSGAVATLAAAADGDDYREPYWRNGGALTFTHPVGESRARLAVAWEAWKPAALEADQVIGRDYRPVRALNDGEVVYVALGLRRPRVVAVETVGGANWEGRIEGAAASVAGDFDYVSVALRAEQLWPQPKAGVGVRLAGAVGGVAGGGVPAQRLFPAGGRGTVRGFSFHEFVGNAYAAGSLELSRAIKHPMLSFALFADVGWTAIEGSGAESAVAVWNEVGTQAGATPGVLVGAGATVGVFYDIFQLDLARGLTNRGIWELVFRVRSEFWGWL
jgi:hypothetical protein